MSQEQQLHAQKMDSLARLVGGVAHDFNIMLTVTLPSVPPALRANF